MRLGVWTPLPHTIRPEPPMEEAILELQTRGGERRADKSFQFALDVVRRAENYGFDITLVAERYLGPDLESWILSSALAALTTNIHIMAAVHPGIITPQVVAKMGASLDRISGGRFHINLVNGWWKEEFELFGNGAWLEEADRRYRRMDEFLKVLKGMWTEDEFSFRGEFYQVESAQLPTKTCQIPYPPIYAASRSETGKDVIARECDVWFMPYQPGYRLFFHNYEQIAGEIKEMDEKSQAYRRRVKYGLSAHVICAPTQKEAEDAADELERYGQNSRVAAIAAKALGVGLVGTPEKIAERLTLYKNIGIDCMMLHFHPMLAGMDTFAREVMPLLPFNIRRERQLM